MWTVCKACKPRLLFHSGRSHNEQGFMNRSAIHSIRSALHTNPSTFRANHSAFCAKLSTFLTNRSELRANRSPFCENRLPFRINRSLSHETRSPFLARIVSHCHVQVVLTRFMQVVSSNKTTTIYFYYFSYSKTIVYLICLMDKHMLRYIHSNCTYINTSLHLAVPSLW